MKLKIFRRLKTFYSFVRVVLDPTRTHDIFNVITDPWIVNEETFRAILEKLHESASCTERIKARYFQDWRLDELLLLPSDSFGHAYAKHMFDNKLETDFYPKILGQDSDATYIQMRSRQTHDIWHILTGFDTSLAGEVGLQAFVQAQISARSPAVVISMFFLHCCIFKPRDLPALTAAISRGWSMGCRAHALFGEKFDDCWEKNLNQYRFELKLEAL